MPTPGQPAHPQLVAQLAATAHDLAIGAGEIAVTGRAAGFSVAAKSSPTDVVTQVDRDVEAWIRTRLSELRPQDAILGEEDGGRSGTSGVRWIVDPIDGTVNFLLGLPQYAVSIAVEIDSVVVAGCVHNPVTGEIFQATLGGGATLAPAVDRPGGQADRPVVLRGPRRVPLERAVVGTGFGYDSARRAAQGRVVARLLPRIGDIRRAGSASLDLCAVAAGWLDAYFEVGLNPWDWSAGLLVATEAGCRSDGLRGRAASERMTAVAGPELAPGFFRLLEELSADDV